MSEFDFNTVTAEVSETPNVDNILRCSEEGCSTELVYSGKGRKPTKCDAHKKRRSVSAPRRLSGKSTKNQHVDYRPGLMGMMQLPAGILAFAGMHNPVFAADAATITIHGPNIAEALNELAKERPEVAAVLDRILAVGPYGLVIAAVTPLVLQLLSNHSVIPSGLMGTVPKEALLAHLQNEAKMQEDAMKEAMAA